MDSVEDNLSDLLPTAVTLDKLSEITGDEHIVVRLLRSWEVRNIANNFSLMSLDLLFLDHKDNLVQASIYHRRIGRFKYLLKDGNIYLLSNFETVPSSKRYTICDNPLMIRLTEETVLREVPNDGTPCIGEEMFRIRSHSRIEELADSNLELLDVVGQLLSVQAPNLDDCTSTQKIMLLILLDNGNTVRVTLWDSQASVFRKLFQESERRSSVLVLTSLNPKRFAGKVHLSSTGATKFFIDNNLKVVRQFFATAGIEDTLKETNVEDEKTLSNRLETWTISQIMGFITEGNIQDKEVVCRGKITEISQHNGWKYLASGKCSRKLAMGEMTLQCFNCNDPTTIGVLRFRIEVLVECENVSSKFVLFDRDVRKLTNATAEELTSPKTGEEEDSPTDKIPDVLNRLIGKIFDFQIRITKYNFRTSFQAFTVSRVLTVKTDSAPSAAETLPEAKIAEEIVDGEVSLASARKRQIKIEGSNSSVGVGEDGHDSPNKKRTI